MQVHNRLPSTLIWLQMTMGRGRSRLNNKMGEQLYYSNPLMPYNAKEVADSRG